MSTQSTPEASPQGVTTLTVDGAIATVTFDRQRARNAMTWAMYDGMAEACVSIASNPNVRVAVFRGAGGKAFVAGTDIEQFSAFESGQDGIDYEHKIARYVAAVAGLKVPTIAAVEGWAVGGGMAIASVCDFRIASAGARFGVPIARTLGNCLSAGNLNVLMAQLGPSMVRRMLLLAEMVPAEELLANGYILAVVPADELDAVLERYTQMLCSHAPVTMAVTKQTLARLMEATAAQDADLVKKAYGSVDFREGVAAFVAKRAPVWHGK